jgi:hypothetical protein
LRGNSPLRRSENGNGRGRIPSLMLPSRPRANSRGTESVHKNQWLTIFHRELELGEHFFSSHQDYAGERMSHQECAPLRAQMRTGSAPLCDRGRGICAVTRTGTWGGDCAAANRGARVAPARAGSAPVPRGHGAPVPAGVRRAATSGESRGAGAAGATAGTTQRVADRAAPSVVSWR